MHTYIHKYAHTHIRMKKIEKQSNLKVMNLL